MNYIGFSKCPNSAMFSILEKFYKIKLACGIFKLF